jgi:hypothetical protein
LFFLKRFVNDITIEYEEVLIDEICNTSYNVIVKYKNLVVLRYSCHGKVCSGDNATFCGNSILMENYWTYAIELYNKESSNKLVEFYNYWLLVKGDDVILFINRAMSKLLIPYLYQVFS